MTGWLGIRHWRIGCGRVRKCFSLRWQPSHLFKPTDPSHITSCKRNYVVRVAGPAAAPAAAFVAVVAPSMSPRIRCRTPCGGSDQAATTAVTS